MDTPQELFALEDKLGLIQYTQQLCPGVYYLAVKQDKKLVTEEYYAVMDICVLEEEVKEYGQRINNLWLFSKEEDRSGCRIVDYEVGKYCVKNHLPQEEPLHDIALYAAEYHPEYFGTYPVPIYTPRGYTTRYWTLENGIYWIETDQCEEVLAVCYPIWSAELSELAEHIEEQTSYDKYHNIHQTLGYIFFPKKMSCLPIYELMQTRSAWEGTLINKPALMNAIWKYIPEYAVLMNEQEQSGRNDLVTMLLRDLGITKEPHILPERMISIYPDVGTDYMMFKKKIRNLIE